MWTTQIRFLILTLAVAIAAPGVAQAATGFGRPTLDGINAPSEWNNAEARPIFGGSFPGSTLYLMNDGDNLYVAVDVQGDSTFTATDTVSLRFDNDLDLVDTDGDDSAQLAGSSTFSDLHFNAVVPTWGVFDSIQNGRGAGAPRFGGNFFEIEKPLSSGDASDFNLGAGDVVGFCLTFFDDGSGNSIYPQSCRLSVHAQSLYDSVAIVPPLIGSGTPIVDGVKGPGEWGGAATRTILLGAYAGSTLYTMNDGQNLYIALEVQGDADLGPSDKVDVRFDEDVNLVLNLNDDAASLTQTQFQDFHFDASSQLTPDAITNGQGAAGRSGSVNFFEIAKPLVSGDPEDFGLGAADRVGLCVIYSANGTSTFETTYPSGCNLAVNGQRWYDMIVITSASALPALGTVGLVVLMLFMIVCATLGMRRRRTA